MITKKYQFPKLTKEMHDDIAKQYKTHNKGICEKANRGTNGGCVIFEIHPLGVGDYVKVKCASCGEVIGSFVFLD